MRGPLCEVTIVLYLTGNGQEAFMCRAQSTKTEVTFCVVMGIIEPMHDRG